jgi:hypothetical protein
MNFHLVLGVLAIAASIMFSKLPYFKMQRRILARNASTQKQLYITFVLMGLLNTVGAYTLMSVFWKR